jgi:hypothetical protein
MSKSLKMLKGYSTEFDIYVFFLQKTHIVPPKTESVLYSVYQFQQDGHVDVKTMILLKVMAHHAMKGSQRNGQKFENTKGLTRRHKSMKDREHNGQKFEDTKEIIRRHKSMKDRQHNGLSIFKLLAIVLSVLH